MSGLEPPVTARTSLDGSFNEDHILATSQAIVEYRAAQGSRGPLYIGMDTHALSEPAMRTAVEVFAGNGVEIVLQEGLGYTPHPGDLAGHPDLQSGPFRD